MERRTKEINTKLVQNNINMSNNNIIDSSVHNLDTDIDRNFINSSSESEPRLYKINWWHVVIVLIFHALGLKGLVILLRGEFMWKTLIYAYLLTWVGNLGMTVGAHRYWCHRAFKANLPLRMLLLLMFTVAAQLPIWWWVAIHRLHHKFSDTEKDPHNATRGFFFSHFTWMFYFDYDRFKEDLKPIDMSDIENDPILMLQNRYFVIWSYIFSFAIPQLIPYYCWGESLSATIFLSTHLRHLYTLHASFSINSFAHLFGTRPYDKNIGPSENKWVTFFILGEAWHNFHHVFPWDYRTSEYGFYKFNPSAAFIDIFARLGWAWDLKTVSQKTIDQRVFRTGDGSYVKYGHGG